MAIPVGAKANYTEIAERLDLGKQRSLPALLKAGLINRVHSCYRNDMGWNAVFCKAALYQGFHDERLTEARMQATLQSTCNGCCSAITNGWRWPGGHCRKWKIYCRR